jgi:hypothetical protein
VYTIEIVSATNAMFMLSDTLVDRPDSSVAVIVRLRLPEFPDGMIPLLDPRITHPDVNGAFVHPLRSRPASSPLLAPATVRRSADCRYGAVSVMALKTNPDDESSAPDADTNTCSNAALSVALRWLDPAAGVTAVTVGSLASYRTVMLLLTPLPVTNGTVVADTASDRVLESASLSSTVNVKLDPRPLAGLTAETELPPVRSEVVMPCMGPEKVATILTFLELERSLDAPARLAPAEDIATRLNNWGLRTNGASYNASAECITS